MSTTSELPPDIYETENECSLRSDVRYEPLDHDHSKITHMGSCIVCYSCEMTLSDEPILNTLHAAEEQLLAKEPSYTPAVRGNALVNAWLCKSALSDSFIDFSPAHMQVAQNEYKTDPLENHLTDEYLPFQSFAANLANTPVHLPGVGSTNFNAYHIFCHGSLDLRIFAPHVDAPNYEDGSGLYTFSRSQRILGLSVHPSAHIYWRPEIGRIKVSRQLPDRQIADELFGADVVNDPHELTEAILAKFVLDTNVA